MRNLASFSAPLPGQTAETVTALVPLPKNVLGLHAAGKPLKQQTIPLHLSPQLNPFISTGDYK